MHFHSLKILTFFGENIPNKYISVDIHMTYADTHDVVVFVTCFPGTREISCPEELQQVSQVCHHQTNISKYTVHEHSLHVPYTSAALFRIKDT